MKGLVRLMMLCALVVGMTGTAVAQEENAELELVHWPQYVGATDGPEAQFGIVPTAFFGRVTGLLPNADYFFGPSGGAYGFLQEGTTATRGSRWVEETGSWSSPSTVGAMGTADENGVIERWFWIRPPSNFDHADDYRVRLRIFRAGMDGHLQFDDDSPADLVALQVHEDAPEGFAGAWIVGDVGTDYEGYVAVVYENADDERPLNAWLVQNHDIGQDGDRAGDIDFDEDDEDAPRTAGRFVTFIPANTSIGRLEIRDEVTGELIASQNSTEWQAGDAGSVTHLANLDLTAVSIEQLDVEVPEGFQLSQNYPNPFNPQTRIEFAIPQGQHVHVAVYNLLGQQIATLVNGFMSAGSYSVMWDGRSATGEQVSSGIYIYQMRSGSHVISKTMTLLK